MAQVAAPEGLALDWLYWLIAAWVGTLAILPYEPVKYVLFAIFWAVFGWVLLNFPRYLPLMVVVGLPAMVFSPNSFRTGIPLANNHTFFLAGLLLAVYLVHKRSTEPHPPNPLKWPPIYLAVLLSASMVVSYVTGAALTHNWARGWHAISLFDLTATLKGTILFPFFAPIAFRLLSTREHLRRTVNVMAVTTLLVSLESLWERRHAILADAVGAYTRVGGFIDEPNGFGGFLALMITLFVSLFLNGKLNKRERFLLALAMGAAGTAILFTLSRGSWLALIAALVYLAVVRGLKAMTFVLLLVLTATIWLPQSVIERARMTLQVDDGVTRQPFSEDVIELEGSASGRIEHWSALIDQWTAAPIFGHGFASYGRLYGHIRERTGVPVAAHSTIIELTAEEGTFGLIAYVWLIWMVSQGARGILRLGKRGDEDPFLHALASGMVAATLCLILLDSSGARMKSPLVMTNMWILAGGLARMYWNQKQVVLAADLEAVRQKLRGRKPRSLSPGQPARRPV